MSVFWTVKNSGEPGVSPFKRGSLSQRSMVGRRMVRAGARAIKPQSKGFRALHPQAAPASCGRQMSFLPLVRIWIWVSVLASVAGWGLSALGQLNRIGYAVFGGLALAGLWLGRKALGLAPAGRLFGWRRARTRFRRWLPASF